MPIIKLIAFIMFNIICVFGFNDFDLVNSVT